MRIFAMALVAFSAAQLLSACGPTTTTEVHKDERLITAKNKDEADEIQQQFNVQCGDPANCNPSIALLIMREDDVHIGVCTSSLIAPDTILTNKHCLPSDLQEAGADCSDRIGFKFPASNGQSAMRADCDHIVAVSAYDVSESNGAKPQPDYAIIKLASSPGRPVLALDRSGINDGDKLTVLRMSPDIKSRMGTIASLECHAVMNTLLTPLYDSPFSPVVNFNACPIVHGNSGSPIVSANGIKALMMEGAADLDQMQNTGLKPIPFGVAVNIGCFNVPQAGFGANLNAHCKEDVSDDANTAAEHRIVENAVSDKTLTPLIAKAAKSASADLPKMFEWKATAPQLVGPDTAHPDRVDNSSIYPTCYQSVSGAKSWLDAYRDAKTKTLATSAKISMQLKILNVRVSVDDENRPASSVTVEPTSVELKFSPAKIAKDGHGTFVIEAEPYGTQIETLDLKPCP